MAIQISGPGEGDVTWTIEVPATERPALGAGGLERELAAAVETVRAGGGGSCRLWIGHVATGDDELVVRWGFTPYRDLWQLRCPLPAPPSDLAVRPFEPGDAPAVLALNRRAFSWHPEQGDMTAADLRERQSEPWYDPAGFLLHEREGRLAGFCWTKVHPAGGPPPDDVAVGEIYVIAVDPDFQGRGIGAPLTLAGLAHLHSRGSATAMLYVESDNRAANAVYERLGLRRHHTDRAYAAAL
ncbi:MAG: mycothiol synthase [bacterium]|nr:mycothiol synthase [bacterium]